MEFNKSVFLIDSCAYFFRYYFSNAYDSSVNGQATGGVYGFASFLVSVLEKYSPGYVACCFDEAFDTCFRNEIYPAYKANRLPPDDDILFQLNACKQFADLMGFSVFAHDRYEADDLMGSLFNQVQEEIQGDVDSGCDSIYIISGDKDFHQLITSPNTYLWDITKKDPLSSIDILKKTNLTPSQWIDYQSLVGDSVDNVPGVKGIGAKTATRLLHEFNSLSGILENIDALTDLKIRNSKNIQIALRDNIPTIALSKILVTIETDLKLVDHTETLVTKPINVGEITKFCRHMGFSQLCHRIEKLS